ncbi:MAG: DUF2680 domain-containing protein [Ruminiclostridium sp.]|nr:DUF2680 domain-containing protein [Ruminiclostridium sp.]
MKKLIFIGITVLTLTAGLVTAFAASQYTTPAEAVAGLSKREVQSVIEERAQTGKSYGTIANEAGVLDEFKEEMLEMKKDVIAARVADGTMTEEQADAIIARIEENQANCDGTGADCGQKGKGLGAGARFGQGNGQDRGKQGRGMGNGCGMGNDLRGGSCGR